MSTPAPAYVEIIDFIAAGASSRDVIQFRPSLAAQQRVEELLEREQMEGLSAQEKSELDHFMQLEHIMRLAKAKAREILARG
jgi:hypothetical protein